MMNCYVNCGLTEGDLHKILKRRVNQLHYARETMNWVRVRDMENEIKRIEAALNSGEANKRKRR